MSDCQDVRHLQSIQAIAVRVAAPHKHAQQSAPINTMLATSLTRGSATQHVEAHKEQCVSCSADKYAACKGYKLSANVKSRGPLQQQPVLLLPWLDPTYLDIWPHCNAGQGSRGIAYHINRPLIHITQAGKQWNCACSLCSWTCICVLAHVLQASCCCCAQLLPP